MTEEEFAKHKQYAGELRPSMHRRRVGHDYTSRRIYLLTMTVEGRRPLLGQLVGQAGSTPEETTARMELSPLGRRVQEEWFAVTAHHPEVSVIALQLMPDHLHGNLFVEQSMQQHFGSIVSGFKACTNKAYRQLVLGQEAAALPQQKRDRSHESRRYGQFWSLGYNDHILSGRGELDSWCRYLADNPRRLFLRRQFPDLFRVSFGLQIGPFTCSAVGNRFLLGYPRRMQVQCSTRLYEPDIQQAMACYMAAAHGGAVLVSPAISEGEKRTMRAAFDAGLPLIFISASGLTSFSKPGGAFFDACAAGRLLILSPWEHQNQQSKLTRPMCMQMNELARLIAETPPQSSEQPN